MKNCELDFNLADVLQRFRPDLQRKIRHSVDLLRKAERLALAYDPADGFFLAFSGGKDSQCLYHVARLAGVRFKAHMNLTSVDPPEVIRFVKSEYPDVDLAKPSDSIYNVAVKKGMLPTRRVRWCCEKYKESAGAGKVTLKGEEEKRWPHVKRWWIRAIKKMLDLTHIPPTKVLNRCPPYGSSVTTPRPSKSFI